jgi:uncharacterized membrane protein
MVQTINFLFTIYIRALIAKVADSTRLHELVPKINTESLETLLGTISASMLVISILRWARWFQHFRQQVVRLLHALLNSLLGMMFREMLFCFIGSFIYSIVATVALKNGYYGIAGNFTLFIFTLLFFCLSNFTFFTMGRAHF